MVLLGAMCEGLRVPAVTIFGWDDVLCPTTHAKVERNKRTSQSFDVPMAQSKDNRKEVGYGWGYERGSSHSWRTRIVFR